MKRLLLACLVGISLTGSNPAIPRVPGSYNLITCNLCLKAQYIDTVRYARIKLGTFATYLNEDELYRYGSLRYESKIHCYNCMIQNEK